MGTVHALSATSAEESFEQLQTCMRGANSYGIVVPQAHFLEQFLRFYPEFPREYLYTPSSLLKACGLEPVPPEIAVLSENFDAFCDPSLLEFEGKDFDAWLKRQSYVFWNCASEGIQPPFERCILFGSFSQKQKQYLINALDCHECFILQRIFQGTEKKSLPNIYLYPHRTIADGYAWVERMKTEHPNTCGILLPNAKEWTTLFRKPLQKQTLVWLDWQEEGTIGSFWAYARTTVDFETLQIWQHDCDKAFRECLADDFNVLREHLLQNGKIWIAPFVRCDLPASAAVSDHVILLQNAKPPQEFSNLPILQTCPSVVTKRAFFAFLRRFLQYRSGFETDVLLWNEAVFLPVKEGFVPQAVSTDVAHDAAILSWMTEIVSRGDSLHLGVPLRDRNGEPLQPLTEQQSPSEFIGTENLLSDGRIGSKELSTWVGSHSAQTSGVMTDNRMYITVSNALSVAASTYEQRPKANILRFPNFEKSKKSSDADGSVPSLIPKNTLCIPKELIRFSCKNWEYFYLWPRKTWLEKILKTVPVPLYPTVSKALFLGESIHDNLTFSRQPRDLNAWEQLIRQRSDVRWQRLCQCNGSKNISLWRQRHQRALEYSLSMAGACEDLLHDGWKLYSEYVLPKESSYTGRIDLLAVHEGKQKIAVIDYKSGLNETFTPRTLKSGYGWQLLLYGQAMQTLYPTYEVELRMVLRTGEAKLLRLNEVDEAVLEMNAWISDFQQSGLYEDLPDEKAEMLPLAFVGGKTRRY